MALDVYLNRDSQPPTNVVTGIVVVVLFVPDLTVAVRRLHDTGRSGWHLLLLLVPFGALFLLAWFLQGSYANRGTAWRVVNKVLTERVDGAVEEYRQMELARLNALQVALWSKAMDGDVRSVDGVLKIIDRRIRLLGLDQVTVKDETPRTVVVDPADLVRWGVEATRKATEAHSSNTVPGAAHLQTG